MRNTASTVQARKNKAAMQTGVQLYVARVMYDQGHFTGCKHMCVAHVAALLSMSVSVSACFEVSVAMTCEDTTLC